MAIKYNLVELMRSRGYITPQEWSKREGYANTHHGAHLCRIGKIECIKVDGFVFIPEAQQKPKNNAGGWRENAGRKKETK